MTLQKKAIVSKILTTQTITRGAVKERYCIQMSTNILQQSVTAERENGQQIEKNLKCSGTIEFKQHLSLTSHHTNVKSHVVKRLKLY